MENFRINSRTARDIDARVKKILRDLDDPEPPLTLELVRDILELDLKYYSTSDDSVLREKVHQIKMAGKQLLKRPSLLLDAVRKFDMSALYLHDQRRILIDNDVPKLKHRWTEAHEIIHSICDWHCDATLGDDSFHLNPQCHARIEFEANWGAGRLLFLRERFEEEANDSQPTIKLIKYLCGVFGNTFSSTLWRVVESSHPGLPMLGMMSAHPCAKFQKEDFTPSAPTRHFMRSVPFATMFPHIGEIEVFSLISQYCAPKRGGPLGDAEKVLQDKNGEEHLFNFETFFNRYDALTLGVYKCPKAKQFAVKTT